jgi:AAA family ATP:ADP antiporter
MLYCPQPFITGNVARIFVEVIINNFLAFLARIIYGENPERHSLISLLTGARENNAGRTILSFGGLFFLLCSYYLLKPLRNASFLQEFDPNELPVFFLFVAFISFLLTKFFNKFSTRLPKEKLITITFGVVILCKIIFYFLLSVEGNISWKIPILNTTFLLTTKNLTIIFYIWSAVYFLLSIALMWACINSLFSSEEGKSSYGFICTGAVSGAFVGSYLTPHIVGAVSPLAVLPFSAFMLAVSLIFILSASKAGNRANKDSSSESISIIPEKKTANPKNFFSELISLVSHKYLRAIGAIVFALAVFNTAFYFQTHKIIDSEMNRQLYRKHFHELLQLQEFSDAESRDWFQFIYKLKLLGNDEERQQKMTEVIGELNETPEVKNRLTQQFHERYTEYRRELNEKMTFFFADTNYYTNIAGIILLIFGSRPLFKILGIKTAVLLCPTFCLLAGILLFFPIGLELVQLLMVAGSALNYSLNNATKELLYIPAGREANFRFKPFIEGPVMRMGDAFTSILKISLVAAVGSQAADNWYVGLTLLIVIYWLWEGVRISGLYEKLLKKLPGKTDPLQEIQG